MISSEQSKDDEKREIKSRKGAGEGSADAWQGKRSDTHIKFYTFQWFSLRTMERLDGNIENEEEKSQKGFIDGKKHQKEKTFSEIGLR